MEDSVTQLVKRAQTGDSVAFEQLWARYFDRLVRLADAKLGRRYHKAASGEDAALSAFKSFAIGLQKDQYPRLANRDDLWHLLIVITHRKARRAQRRERRVKRGGGNVRGDSIFQASRDDEPSVGFAQVLGQEPPPDAWTIIDEQIAKLPDDSWRQVVVLKLQGYTNVEISAKLKCSLRSVERKLENIRDCWNLIESS